MQAEGDAGTAPVRTFTEAGRRAQIVAAAIETIADVGYANASFARIARRAGLSSTGLISYHFAGKSDLMAQVAQETFAAIGEHMAARMSGASGPAQALEAYIRGITEFIAGHRPDGSPNCSHAWARTVDGVQGGTWPQVHLLGTAALERFTGYTAQSRSRQATHTWHGGKGTQH